MTQGRRVRLSAEQRTDMWRCWQAGESHPPALRSSPSGMGSIRPDLRQAVEGFVAAAGRGHGTARTSTVRRWREEVGAGDECSHHRSSTPRCPGTSLWWAQEKNRSNQPRWQDGSGSHVCGLGRSQSGLPGDGYGGTLRDEAGGYLWVVTSRNLHNGFYAVNGVNVPPVDSDAQ
jgi:hypothetical protein